jgi:hypothetical protein|tara:strand:+ start:242 stop:457 length:216 start_codon:yes stop_codon:yes gene_type:complete
MAKRSRIIIGTYNELFTLEPLSWNILTIIFWKQARSLIGDTAYKVSFSKVTDIKKKNENLKQLVVEIAFKE